jgi:hypothetical protein
MYSVRPAGKKNDITPNISGMPYCMNFCCVESTAAGWSRACTNIVATRIAGRM